MTKNDDDIHFCFQLIEFWRCERSFDLEIGLNVWFYRNIYFTRVRRQSSSHLHDPSFRTRMALKTSDKLEITEEILELLESKRKVYLRAVRHN